MKFESVEQKVIVITGASSGIGKGTARALARLGANVVIAARRENLLDDLVHEIELFGGQAIAVPTDVSSEDDIRRLAESAVTRFGRIDVWVNDAGTAAIGEFESVSLQDHLQVIQTDMVGTLLGSYAAFQQFRKQDYCGTIINLSSVLGKIPTTYYASYVAAKFGVVGFDASLRQEVKQRKLENIHVCTVLPMAMDTPFFEHAANTTPKESVPIPPTYDPEKAINAIVNLITHPKDEVIAGEMGIAMNIFHHIAPGLVEAMMAKETQVVQMEKADDAPPTAGAVQEPVAAGTDVSGGLK